MSQESRSDSFLTNRVSVILLVLAVIGFVAACVFAVLLWRSFGEDDASPTPFPTVVSNPITDEVEVVVVSESSTLTVTLSAPASMAVKGQDFSVETQAIDVDGLWQPVVQGPGTAVWVYGTIVNYVLGVPYSDENQALFEQLAIGDEISLVTQGGDQYTFTFNSRDIVPANDRDVFAQTSPSVTLILLNPEDDGQATERLVIRGDYIVPETESADLGNVFEMSEIAQLEDIQIAVNGATYVSERPEIPPGFAFYMVDYQLQNIGLTAFDTSRLETTLVDTLGNQYALSSQASQLGNFPPLSGFLNAGQLVEVTIGYQIPVGLISPTLSWVVSRNDTGSQASINIPFNSGSRAEQASLITLVSADLSPDFTNLILTGNIVSASDQPIIIGEQEVTLRTDDGAGFLLLATNPAFPWTVAPGQTLDFSVTFQRPPANTATFTVANQSFLLSNLR